MKKLATWRWAVGSVALSSALAVGLWGLSTGDVLADRDKHSDKDRHTSDYDDDSYKAGSRSQRHPVSSEYLTECGSCHLAYPAKLLNAESWQAILSGLDDHFGENAELATLELNQIQDYLVRYAADNSSYQNRRYSSTDDSTGLRLRITEQPFFIRKHDEIPTRIVADNPQVGSFSQCDSCHSRAVEGNFDEDQVNIPGYGRWD